MIDAAALRKQATNRYPGVVEALLRGENPFPLKLRYPRIKTMVSREVILRDIATLQAEQSHRLTIEWIEVNTVKYGRNSLPGDISLATEADFLGYIGKREEMHTIRGAAETLVQAFPEVRPQLPELWRLLREGPPEFWHQVVRVVRFFKESPFPERYIRELPIKVHTKFIGEHRTLIERLIGVVSPQSLRSDGETFEERLGLKTPDALIECRLLDDALLPEWRFRQFTVGLGELNYLESLPAHTVFITENRTNFLTLPPLGGTIALQGQGYAVSRLRCVPFLKEKRILYWGDIDAHGFEILAILRREFPQVESLMMDAQTWTEFAGFRVRGTQSQNAFARYLPFLNPQEEALYRTVSEKIVRLEQEKINQKYAESEIFRKFTNFL